MNNKTIKIKKKKKKKTPALPFPNEWAIQAGLILDGETSERKVMGVSGYYVLQKKKKKSKS
jgi:hypothetical protein